MSTFQFLCRVNTVVTVWLDLGIKTAWFGFGNMFWAPSSVATNTAANCHDCIAENVWICCHWHNWKMYHIVKNIQQLTLKMSKPPQPLLLIGSYVTVMWHVLKKCYDKFNMQTVVCRNMQLRQIFYSCNQTASDLKLKFFLGLCEQYLHWSFDWLKQQRFEKHHKIPQPASILFLAQSLHNLTKYKHPAVEAVLSCIVVFFVESCDWKLS